MTTQAYYKDRLGFDPNDPREMSSLDPTLHGYEENLSKFKGEFLLFSSPSSSSSSFSFSSCFYF